jgi:hypothetical protein
VLGAAIDVQFTELREAGAAAQGSKAAQDNFRRLGGLWGRGSADVRQQLSQQRIAQEQEVQQRNPFRVDALHIEQGVNFLAQQVERQARVLDRIVPRILSRQSRNQTGNTMADPPMAR